jgi:uncharacterized protein
MADANGTNANVTKANVTPAQITATPKALEAIRQLIAEHGPIMFHTSGGRVGGRSYPICLPADALRLGARDHLLGTVEGVAIYEMEDREGSTRCGSADYVLDVAPGLAIGFSFAAAPGLRFTLRADQPRAAEVIDQHDACS